MITGLILSVPALAASFLDPLAILVLLLLSLIGVMLALLIIG